MDDKTFLVFVCLMLGVELEYCQKDLAELVWEVSQELTQHQNVLNLLKNI